MHDQNDAGEHGPRVHHDASEGFDATEPESGPIWLFAIGSAIALVLVIGAIQQYFEKVWNDAVYEKVLEPPSQQLHDLRGRDDWDLTHYMYLNKDAGQVRIPLDQARTLFLQEIASGKPFYPGKPAAPKKDDKDGWQGTAASAPTAEAAPGDAAGSDKKEDKKEDKK